MPTMLIWLIPLVLLIIVLAAFRYRTPRLPFEDLYARVPGERVASLQTFRQEYPLQQFEVDGINWEYVALGHGETGILFLHGMTGAYDIWWQQLEALTDSYKLISITTPAVKSLAAMRSGVLAILERECLRKVNVVGSSLGGYFTQYLISSRPEMIHSAVLANTFPPNDLIAEKNRVIGALLPYLPEWLVMAVLRANFRKDIFQAGGCDELLLAYLLEISYGRMSKAQVVGRFRCVVNPFEAPDVRAINLPVMIVETANDPLVEPTLREQLKAAYPTARVENLGNVGHFPYLNQQEEYTALLRDFFGETSR